MCLQPEEIGYHGPRNDGERVTTGEQLSIGTYCVSLDDMTRFGIKRKTAITSQTL